jgi:hypothetical protein
MLCSLNEKIHVLFLRVYKDTGKLECILGSDHQTWRKIPRFKRVLFATQKKARVGSVLKRIYDVNIFVEME